MSTFKSFAALSMLALVLAACGTPTATVGAPTAAAPTEGREAAATSAPTSPTQAASVRGGEFVMALSGGVPTLDPAHAGFDFVSWSMTIAIYSSLVDYDEGLGLVGDLASDWELSGDQTTYTFHLRPNLGFSDGTPLTSEDVKFSLERILDPDTASEGAWLFTNIVGADDFSSGSADSLAGIETPDDATVVIHLQAPQTFFLNILAMPFGRIVSKAQVARYGDEITNNPLGSGPFALERWDPGTELVLARNPNYYDPDRPYLDKVTILLNQNDQTRILEFQRGELSISDIPSAAYAQITGDPKYEPYLVTNDNPDNYFIGMKNNQEPFDEVKVRQALNYAVDKDRLVQLQNGRAVVSHGVIPPPMAGYDPDAEGYPYDPGRAQELLTEAGYPDGFSTEIWTPNDETSVRIVQSVVENLAAVGVKAEVRAVDNATFYSRVGDENDVPMFFTFWWQDFPDAYDFFSNLLTKANWGPTNSAYYYNPTVDENVEAMAHLTDQDARIDLMREAERLVVEGAPWIFLYHTITVNVRQPNVRYFIHPVHIWRYSDYWVEPAQ